MASIPAVFSICCSQVFKISFLQFLHADLRSGKRMRQVTLRYQMAHRALTARQQGCPKAIRGHPPACGRHALLKPHWSSQSLKTSSRRSAPTAVAGAATVAADEAADNAAAARDDKAHKQELGADWLRNLPEDVQYDFIVFQIWILERRLMYLRDAAEGTAFLPDETEECFRLDFDNGHGNLW